MKIDKNEAYRTVLEVEQLDVTVFLAGLEAANTNIMLIFVFEISGKGVLGLFLALFMLYFFGKFADLIFLRAYNIERLFFLWFAIVFTDQPCLFLSAKSLPLGYSSPLTLIWIQSRSRA